MRIRPQKKDHEPRFARSLNLLNKLARLPRQIPQLSALFDGFARIPPMLQGVLVPAQSARSPRATMHPSAPFPAHRCNVVVRDSWIIAQDVSLGPAIGQEADNEVDREAGPRITGLPARMARRLKLIKRD